MIKIDLYGYGQRMVAVSPGAQIFGGKSRSDVSGRFSHSGCPKYVGFDENHRPHP